MKEEKLHQLPVLVYTNKTNLQNVFKTNGIIEKLEILCYNVFTN